MGEFITAEPSKKGLLISFNDGSAKCLPERVFSSRQEKLSLVAFIDVKLAEQKKK